MMATFNFLAVKTENPNRSIPVASWTKAEALMNAYYALHRMHNPTSHHLTKRPKSDLTPNGNSATKTGLNFGRQSEPLKGPSAMPKDNNQVSVLDEVSNKVEHLKPYVVIVWNDEEHSALFVMGVLMEVCKMSKEEAVKATLAIHEDGKAPVWKGHKELAELKRDQIATFRDEELVAQGAPNVPLNVTIAEG